jgi:hypothetical protein
MITGCAASSESAAIPASIIRRRRPGSSSDDSRIRGSTDLPVMFSAVDSRTASKLIGPSGLREFSVVRRRAVGETANSNFSRTHGYESGGRELESLRAQSPLRLSFSERASLFRSLEDMMITFARAMCLLIVISAMRISLAISA